MRAAADDKPVGPRYRDRDDEKLKSMDPPVSVYLSVHILDTRGVGKGLDDESLDPAIEATALVILLHPHYAVDSQTFEKKSNGHVLASGTGVSHLTGKGPNSL
ncbi:uncharacterized protein EV420DRAFT_1635384 [Desarmillaria tabescens]|uniref:Uncharacterized protein n=1 Tax=Armillaria tabescens TaxID=1929756 RepID=A0AA39NM13_ARMTA|nr:uncharacterized protein EV420DRAFT_1635384 [Desarmillaria tabescens]KAK0468127.1 hypothetical protein EV420DRAFT_1635384 [Desarmillaria tabescens]